MEHDETSMYCFTCKGSGEGLNEGWTCLTCGGSGIVQAGDDDNYRELDENEWQEYVEATGGNDKWEL